MKSIPLDKLVCGNCKLRIDGKCQIDGTKVDQAKPYCYYIFKNFEDRGYEWKLA